MKKVLLLLVAAVLVTSLVSCMKCQKCEPVVKVRFVVPQFVCPVPDAPVIVDMPADARICFSLPEQADREACEKKKMENVGTNVTSYRNTLNMWTTQYQWCVEHTIELYKKASEDVNTTNDTVEEPNK